MAKEITGNEFTKDVLDAKGPVLVDFFAPWCGPCKMLAPVLDRLAPEFEGKVAIYKLNIDENPELAQKYGILSIPNLKIFKDGEVVENIVGLQPEDVLKDLLTKASA